MKTCKNGHVDSFTRKDGRCAKCHLERNRRYRKTDKGRAKDARYEAKRTGSERRRASNQAREQKPERWFYKIKYALLARINRKKKQIDELEGALPNV